MARVTVEDCIDKVDNRFELVLLAAHRARTIASGASILVPRDNDKNPVVALREIADEKLTPEDLDTKVRISADLKQHVAWIEEYLALGFEQVYLHQTGRDQARFIDAFGEKVLPAIGASGR